MTISLNEITIGSKLSNAKWNNWKLATPKKLGCVSNIRAHMMYYPNRYGREYTPFMSIKQTRGLFVFNRTSIVKNIEMVSCTHANHEYYITSLQEDIDDINNGIYPDNIMSLGVFPILKLTQNQCADNAHCKQRNQ